MDKPVLWYFADPMCSWCWGFSPVITRIKNDFGDQLNVSLNLGGLRPGTVEPISDELRDEILHHWHEVHRLTGQDFLFDNAIPPGFIYDTEPASRAVLTFEKIQPENALAYFSSIQSAFYAQRLNVTHEDVLIKLAESLAIDPKEFQALFVSADMRALTQEHFKRSRQMGVQGFPSLVWQHDTQTETLSRGYLPWENIAELIEQRIPK